MTTRPGYQRIKARVTAGLTEAIFVFHSSRLGRDASERLRLQRELKKLRVPLYSCQQGELRADLVGGVYALMDEQFSIDLAFKVKNAMPSAVKAGVYPARTPVGYKRVWPQGPDAKHERKSRPDMVIDAVYGPLVQDIFRKYGVEGWSIRAIVGWLNTRPDRLPNPNSATGVWNIGWVCRMLRNAVYVGEIVRGRRKYGYYDHYEGKVLRSGEGDCGPTRHKPLIERPVWEAVQMKLQTNDPRHAQTTRKGRTPDLLSGFLVCRGCGGPTRAKYRAPGAPSRSQYLCMGREREQSTCAEPACAMGLGDDAVLREVARLRGSPWSPQPLEAVVAADPHAAERAGLEAQIAAARRELAANRRLLVLLTQDGDPGPETLDDFRGDQQALDRQIHALQARLDGLPRQTVDLAALAALRDRLTRTDVATLIAGLWAQGDITGLRDLLAATVQSAQIVARVGGGRNGKTGWVRAAVVWTSDVQLLLDHGYLRVAAAPEPPVPARPSTSLERVRRWRAKRRAARAAQRPPVPADLLTIPQAAETLGMTVVAIRGAVRRRALTAIHLPEWPQRAFLQREELERYRQSRLGKPGPKSRADAVDHAEL